ncbi:hypothetical protein J3Q64DRAFT_1775484 [Phycomyces blakesleeanus]|uniref:Serine/threonine-protein phosphatase 2A activator n=2 Tax=Phycomyces blakesleeanus TaxID=4837 RepID=A0A167LYY7_PHYB8|nr:hypothetical protein PHYBLDRAFT_21674 [Phycomyces blakesleeanus NRRL 1555(-)]OAD71377.1 hypothetical protein PHYBLDRAFT_21674 [Phycomyces blakesleeanus NRRL 1555(-)]|eukprot:XP_018289417.1 hypothetical protein PHYBLDRAFT_21674 [Phycomyces blakesleeanus NRRL 1555(-)]
MESIQKELPFLLDDYVPTQPKKVIHTQADIEPFLHSKAFSRIMTFVFLLNGNVTKKKNSDPCEVSAQTEKVLEMLQTLDSWIEEFPPLDNPQRFGNKAFRLWLDKLEKCGPELLRKTLPEKLYIAIPELHDYLLNGFGNGTRIDYGSGHELSFCAFLCGLTMLGVFEPKDYQALVTRVFVTYLELVRHIQRVYSLEPAGSHGVWGLDDHQFLPYIWGSAQLIDHPRLKPASAIKPEIIEMYSKEYMYLRCLEYIGEVKTGPFHEHSPMLFDISAVANWSKVNSGMAKMYIAEVLKKVPVVQHFRFGFLFPYSG